MLSKILCFLMGVGGFSLGTWGIYESTRTVEIKILSEGERITLWDSEDTEWEEIIINLRFKKGEQELNKFLEIETGLVPRAEKLKQQCRTVANTRRWNWNYKQHYNNFKIFCTKEINPN